MRFWHRPAIPALKSRHFVPRKSSKPGITAK
jgi:hypothetical protein